MRELQCEVGGDLWTATDIGIGPPVVLIHAFPLDSRMWRFVQVDLEPSRRVISVDLPGFGKSRSGSDASPTIEHWAGSLLQALEHWQVPAPFTVCGLSMGGYVALECWRQAPQKIDKLILCDTRAEADTDAQREARAKFAQEVLREGSKVAVTNMLPKLLGATSMADEPELIEELQAWIERVEPKSIAGALQAMARRRDFKDQLTKIECPVACIVGAEDQVTPPVQMQALAAAIPNGSCRVIAEAGHLPPLEQPTAFCGMLRRALQI
jgi:pimeloyl-ACP methyl ester carboxylesterase